MILEPQMSRNAKLVWGGTSLLLFVVGIVVLLAR
jgi:hypothetical protein